MLTTILATLVVLGVLIFVHELGHFVTAKLVDIEVPRFSIGFGPKLIGFKRGETEYVISVLPLGGYVKMAGMEEMEAIEGGAVGVGEKREESAVEQVGPRTPRPRDFESKSLAARTLVISAGVIMNLLFALVVYTISAMAWGIYADQGTTIGGILEEALPAGAEPLANIRPGSRITAVNENPVETRSDVERELGRARAGDARISFDNAAPIAFALPTVDTLRALVMFALEPAVPVPPVLPSVREGGPADRAGLRAEDRIVRAGGRDIATWQQFVDVIEKSPGQAVPLVVARGNEQLEVTVTPRDTVFPNGIRVGRIDVTVPSSRQYVPRTRPTPLQAAARGAQQTWEYSAMTVDFLAGMFTGRQSPRNVGGAIMIGQLSGRAARAGLEEFLFFMAILSINLAILNLLPIPVLDGGHLVFLGIEAVRGRPLSFEQRMRLTQVGFVFIILLMAWALGNDVLRVIGI